MWKAQHKSHILEVIQNIVSHISLGLDKKQRFNGALWENFLHKIKQNPTPFTVIIYKNVHWRLCKNSLTEGTYNDNSMYVSHK